jgi:hypothetical protein
MLHRTASEDRDNDNRDESKVYCAEMLRALKLPKPSGHDCDEYPFAATHEGSAGDGTDRNVAVEYVDEGHNRSVGGKLGWFFQDFRVFGYHAETGADARHPFERFYVKIPE